MRDFLASIRMCSIFTLLFLGVAGSAHSQFYVPQLGMLIPDPQEVPSAAQVQALEADAAAGNWAVKQQFAAAYLYEYLKSEYWNRGCVHLKFGHLCRALADRPESGKRFLQEIIDLDRKGPIDQRTLAVFQADFASRRLSDARPEYSPQHPACQEVVRYYERAIENELALNKGESCTARRMAYMTSLGQCVLKNDDEAGKLFKKSGTCPNF